MTDLLTDPYLDELRQSAPSDRLCAAGADTTPSPRSGPGGTETIFTLLADIAPFTLKVNAAAALVFALAWVLVR